MFRRRPSLSGQRGSALVEYVLLLTLVGLAAVMGVSFFGYSVSAEMGVVANEVASLFGAGSSGSGSASSGSGTGGATSGGGNGHGHGAGNGGHNNGNGSGGADNGTGNGK